MIDDPLISIYSDAELKAELKRRKADLKSQKNKDPPQVREPVWYRVVHYFVMWWFGIGLIILSPIWGTFWVGAKLYQQDIIRQKKYALDNGQDWYKYHPKEKDGDFKN